MREATPLELEMSDVVERVKCDLCKSDYTHSPLEGGFVFEHLAICPICAPEVLKDAHFFHEEAFIRATCPENTSFRDFILKYRGPNG